MTDEEMEQAAAIQVDGERRVEPYVPMLHMRMRQIMKAAFVSMSDLTIVLPEADWERVKEEDRPVMLFGCRVVLTDVPTAMVAVSAPAGPVAYVAMPADAEGGTPRDVSFTDFPVRTDDSLEPGEIAVSVPHVEYRPQRGGM